uniref:zinc-ribbon domain-containing protein n=1 Tax=Terrisporobacter sp. TaxID=1965305 RepID=UPI0026229A40
QEDLDFEMQKIGISITNFAISSVSYPKEVQEMANKAASHSMIGDMNKYTQVAMADSLSKEGNGSVAADMASVQIGMMMGQQVVNNMVNNPQNNNNQQVNKPNFCPNCGTRNEGSNFCPNCGTKLG